jgi:hypothetical protein
MNTDVLTRVRAEIDARLIELRPTLAEYQRLLDAEQALADKAEQARAAKAEQALAAKTEKALAAKTQARAAKAEQALAAKTEKALAAKTSATGAIERAASSPRGTSQQAIVAALEHGSHTLGELTVVTAISSSEIRDSVRKLQRAGTIARTRREGRVAYALLSSAAG